MLNRREILATWSVAMASWGLSQNQPCLGCENSVHDELTGLIGVTTGSFQRHFTDSPQEGKLYPIDLPKILSEELGMRVLDLFTASFPYAVTCDFKAFDFVDYLPFYFLDWSAFA